MGVRSREWDAATGGAGGRKREEDGPTEQSKTWVTLFMDFSTIPTAGEGLKPWEERKEGEEESLEPYLSSGDLFDLQFSMNMRRGCRRFHGEKRRN